MKKLFLALALSMALTSCGDSTASDGYRFEPTTQRIADRPIQVVLYKDQKSLLGGYAKHPSGRPLSAQETLRAFAVINSQACVIHAIDPKISYEPEFIGHELTHCLYGNFHPSQDER